MEVLDGGVLFVIDGDGAHLVELSVECADLLAEVGRGCEVLLVTVTNTLFESPYLVDGGFDGVYEFGVHLVLVV